MIKIFDCSNSLERPLHRGGGGPKENEIVKYLKLYASDFNCCFVDDFKKADVCFTNDVFSKNVLSAEKPLVKRMDGVFSIENFVERNALLNKAACEANDVIFISNFSKESFEKLYPNLILKNKIVALNKADPFEFKLKTSFNSIPKKCISIATDWERKEKRFLDTLNLFFRLKNIYCFFVGKPPSHIDCFDRIFFLGYMNNYAKELNDFDFMVSLSYKDPAPKTLVHGITSGLPCLYVNSGGQKEIVNGCGLEIEDNINIDFEKEIPTVDVENINIDLFFEQYSCYYQKITARNFEKEFELMLSSYFDIFKKY